MWTWLAWFITFNFINITWIFFRAKDFESAMKVLKGMVNIDSIIISKQFAWFLNSLLQLPFYTFLGSQQGFMYSANTYLSILLAMMLVVYLKNSNSFLDNKKLYLHWIGFIIFSFLSFIFLSIQADTSPFLYFNF